MDWNAAIEKNREALKRVLAMLVAMTGLGNWQSAIAGRQSGSAADGPADCQLPTADCRFLLPRHLHRTVLRLLRPAEAAARRLVIIAARGVVIAVSPKCQPKTALQQARFMKNAQATRNAPGPPPPTPPHKGVGIAHVALRTAANMRGGSGAKSPSPLWGSEGRARQAARPGTVRGGGQRPRELRLSFPLFDPLRRFRHARPARNGVPRISFPGFGEPFAIPLPPSANDPVDARRLALRFAALAKVLDDLPREAMRFARWKARRDAGRVRRVWPLRPGRPPGHRPARGGRPWHTVDDILETVHGLAFWALESPDTS